MNQWWTRWCDMASLCHNSLTQRGSGLCITGLSLIHIMTCCPDDTEPLPKPVINDEQQDNKSHPNDPVMNIKSVSHNCLFFGNADFPNCPKSSASHLCWSHSGASCCSIQITISNQSCNHANQYPACNHWKYFSVLKQKHPIVCSFWIHSSGPFY